MSERKKKTTSMSDCYFRYFRYFYAIKHCWHLQSNTLHSQHSVNTRKKMNEQDTIIMIIFLNRRCEPAKGQRLLCPFVRFMRWTIYNKKLINRSEGVMMTGMRTNEPQITICIAIFRASRNYGFICYDLFESAQRISWSSPYVCVQTCLK